jgi:hypothetical protein
MHSFARGCSSSHDLPPAMSVSDLPNPSSTDCDGKVEQLGDIVTIGSRSVTRREWCLMTGSSSTSLDRAIDMTSVRAARRTDARIMPALERLRGSAIVIASAVWAPLTMRFTSPLCARSRRPGAPRTRDGHARDGRPLCETFTEVDRDGRRDEEFQHQS